MAESIVQVTEGSGKKLHTWNRTIGANSVEDEFTVNGEQPLATYNAIAAGVSWTTLNSHVIQLMAGASLNVYVRRIEVYQTAVATAAILGHWEIRRIITAAGTGGTAITPAPFDTTDAASGATAMTLPTVKGTESTVVFSGSALFIQTLGASAPAAPFPKLFEIDFEKLRGKALRIPAGTTNGIVLKNWIGVAAATVSVNVVFTEANF